MASSNSESHADGLLSHLRRIPNFFAELKCDRVQAFAYNGDIHKLVSFKTSDAFIEFWGVPQDCLSSEPPCSAAHSAFTFDNLLQAANLVATAFLHPNLFSMCRQKSRGSAGLRSGWSVDHVKEIVVVRTVPPVCVVSLYPSFFSNRLPSPASVAGLTSLLAPLLSLAG